MTHQTDVDVVIIGAGPTGLTLACLLARSGVRFKIIEKNKSSTIQSKALILQARTLELFEQLDLHEKVIALGYLTKGLDLYVHGKLKSSVDLKSFGKELTKYPYMLILEQHKTEQLLLEKLNLLGGGVEWEKELIEIQQHPQSVTVILSHHERIEVLNCKFLVAADGVHSKVRSLLKLPFIGSTRGEPFFLADVSLEGPLSREHMTLCLSREGFAGFFPMLGEDRFRAIGQWHEKWQGKNISDIAEEIQRQAHLPLHISSPTWIASYQAPSRALVRFRDHRCFFVGDAAHIHSPLGSYGVNTGIQDVFNLAWKINLVLKGRAHEKLLETYHDERFPVAKKLIHHVDLFFSLLVSSKGWARWTRLYLLSPLFRLLIKTEAFRSHLFKSFAQIGISYRKSYLSEQEFLSEADFKAGDRSVFHSVDGCFHAYLVGEPLDQERITSLLEKYFEDRVKVHTLTKGEDVPSVLQRYGIFRDGLVLVRPDGYTAYCAENPDPGVLKAYLDRYFIPITQPLYKEEERQEEFPFETFL